MKKFIQRFFPLCALLCMTSFSFVSRAEFDIYDYYKSPLMQVPGTRKLNDRSWTSTEGTNSNYFSDWNLYFELNPDWDPLNPSSAQMYLWGPSVMRITNSKFSGSNYLMGGSFRGGGRYYMENVSFNQRSTASGKDGYGTVISNTNAIGTMDVKDNLYNIADSDFNDKTSIQTTARVSDSGGVGTQINSSTFNDDTSISVANGGMLEINDSVINLANENIMEQYLGSNSPLVSRVNSILTGLNSFSTGLQSAFNTFLSGFRGLSGWLQWLIIFFSQWYDSSDGKIEYDTVFGEHWFMYLPGVAFYSYEYKNEQVVGTYSYSFVSFPVMVSKYVNQISSYINANTQQFFNWFYPLKSNTPLYWRFYNTDTGKSEETNIAGVLYNITWYLGELYKTNDWDAGSGFDDARDKIEDLTDNMHNAETGITNTVLPNIQNFAPDPSEITSLSALSFIGDYLQKIYVALGAFAVPITLSLVLAVCMQLVGYFKYKR